MRNYVLAAAFILLCGCAIAVEKWEDVASDKASGSTALVVLPGASVMVYNAGCTVSSSDAGSGTTLTFYSCANLSGYALTIEIDGEQADVSNCTSTSCDLSGSIVRSAEARILKIDSKATIYSDPAGERGHHAAAHGGH